MHEIRHLNYQKPQTRQRNRDGNQCEGEFASFTHNERILVSKPITFHVWDFNTDYESECIEHAGQSKHLTQQLARPQTRIRERRSTGVPIVQADMIFSTVSVFEINTFYL